MKNLLLLFCVGIITHTVVFSSSKPSPKTLQQLLQAAIGRRDQQTIKSLVALKASADMTSKIARHTALHLATNSTTTLELLFEIDPQGSVRALRMKNKNGRTPFEKADQGYKTNLHAEEFLKQKLKEHPVKAKAIATMKVPIITSSAPTSETATPQAAIAIMPPLTLLAHTAKAVAEYENKINKIYGLGQYRKAQSNPAEKEPNLALPKTTNDAAKLLCAIGRAPLRNYKKREAAFVPSDKTQKLWDAIKKGPAKNVATAVLAGGSITAQNDNGNNAFHLAYFSKSKLEAIASNANKQEIAVALTTRNNSAQTPLNRAIALGKSASIYSLTILEGQHRDTQKKRGPRTKRAPQTNHKRKKLNMI